MKTERSLLAIVEPFTNKFIDYLVTIDSLMEEIEVYLKMIPREELSPEKMEEFLQKLTESIMNNLPNKKWLTNIRPIIPDIIRTNFALGFQFSNRDKNE